MGVGAAVIFPTTLSLITNIFADPIMRAKAIGVWRPWWESAWPPARSPEAGYWSTSRGLGVHGQRADRCRGHRRRRPVHSTSRTRPLAGRRPRLFLSAIGITALVYTVIEAPNWGWSSGRTAAGFGWPSWFSSGSRCGTAHFASDARRVGIREPPILRREPGSDGGFLTLFGFIFVITQYFQFIKGYSAFETGMRLLPVAASIVVGSVLGPRLVEKSGRRPSSRADWSSSPQA